jgi:hypothetical protein
MPCLYRRPQNRDGHKNSHIVVAKNIRKSPFTTGHKKSQPENRPAPINPAAMIIHPSTAATSRANFFC